MQLGLEKRVLREPGWSGGEGVRGPASSFGRAVCASLLARLRDYQGLVVVDSGIGLLDPPVRAALDTAGQPLLVTDSSADTAGLVVLVVLGVKLVEALAQRRWLLHGG